MHLRSMVLISTLGLLGACSLHIDRDTRLDASHPIGSIYQIDGSIDLAPGGQAGNLSSVSAPITLQHDARAKRLRTVDGRIDLEPRAIALDNVMSVEGAVNLAADARVLGRVQTLTGPITLTDAIVGQGLETVSGTLRLTGKSRVNHGITLSKPGPKMHGKDIERLPTLIVGPNVEIAGKVIAERGATIWVSRTAKVDAVEGARVHWFDGNTPPTS